MNNERITTAKVADFDSDLPEYDVFVNGEHVGTVWKAWFRAGGTQWTHRAGSIGPAGRTRATAITHLLQTR